jgi:hypothetical protein
MFQAPQFAMADLVMLLVMPGHTASTCETTSRSLAEVQLWIGFQEARGSIIQHGHQLQRRSIDYSFAPKSLKLGHAFSQTGRLTRGRKEAAEPGSIDA